MQLGRRRSTEMYASIQQATWLVSAPHLRVVVLLSLSLSLSLSE
jgi:hypothetical protein